MFGFSAVAYDVFGEQSLHLLQPLDDNLHRFSQSLDPVVVELVFRQCISNSAIYTGMYRTICPIVEGEMTLICLDFIYKFLYLMHTIPVRSFQ